MLDKPLCTSESGEEVNRVKNWGQLNEASAPHASHSHH